MGEGPRPEVARVAFCHICDVTADYFWVCVGVELNIFWGSYVSGFELVEGARGHSEGFSLSLHEYDEEDNPEEEKADAYFFHL